MYLAEIYDGLSHVPNIKVPKKTQGSPQKGEWINQVRSSTKLKFESGYPILGTKWIHKKYVPTRKTSKP